MTPTATANRSVNSGVITLVGDVARGGAHRAK
jgi:hypothetical protein